MKHQVILVTGASSGLGKAAAKYLAEKGHIVYGTSRKEVKDENVGFSFLQMDVTDELSVQRAVQSVVEQQGRIDVVINNAGMGIGGPIETTTSQEMALQMNTNFMGTAYVCQAVLPFMRSCKKGRIINVSSIGGAMGLPFQGFYSASKFAVEGYSEALQLEVHPFGIEIVLVEPGDFATGFTAGRIWSKGYHSDSPYKKVCDSVVAVIESEEQNGWPPVKFAQAILTIVECSHPRFRYRVANPLQSLSVTVKKWLPDRCYHKVLGLFYKM